MAVNSWQSIFEALNKSRGASANHVTGACPPCRWLKITAILHAAAGEDGLQTCSLSSSTSLSTNRRMDGWIKDIAPRPILSMGDSMGQTLPHSKVLKDHNEVWRTALEKGILYGFQ